MAKKVMKCACYGTKMVEGKEMGCFALERDAEVQRCDGLNIFCPFYKSIEQVKKTEALCQIRGRALGFKFKPATELNEEFY